MPDMTRHFDPVDPVDPDGQADTPVEAQLRQLLGERAGGLAQPETPYGTIVRHGRAARRRGRIALGAGAAVLAAAVPATLGASGVLFEDDPTATAPPPSGSGPEEERDGVAELPPTVAPEEGAQGPSDPERQLLDGITLEQARDSLERCLDEFGSDAAGFGEEYETPEFRVEDLRIVLAWEALGDENRGEGPFTQVLAVNDDPSADPYLQFVCSDSEEGAQGLQSAVGGGTPDNGLPVYPDSNAARYFRPGLLGQWELPFRWADFGLVAPEVERVTVMYGGATEEAVLDAGYFVVAGIAEERPEAHPVVVGYGADGEVLYDSREDPGYEQG
jgi:hypothetical protein